MKISYQTGLASLIQFIIVSVLGVPYALISIISTCSSDHTNCISNLVVSLIYFILTVIWFGIIAGLGFYAQEKRKRFPVLILIGCEFINLGIFGFIDFPGSLNIIDKIISLVTSLVSVWVIYIAIRLFLSGGGRVVKRHRITKIFKDN